MASIIVVFPKSQDAVNIRNMLVRNGYRVTAVCTSGAQALQAADDLEEGIVVCGYRYTDMLCTQLREDLPMQFEMLLIASGHVLANCSDDHIIKLSLPLKLNDLLNTVEMLTEQIARRRRKANKLPKKRSEKDQMLIDKAKKLLMDRNGMTEEEAHRYMQKCSMDSGTNMVETAKMVFTLMRI